MITTNVMGLGATVSVGSYSPDCSGSYNPCTEVLKAHDLNRPVTATLQAKCTMFQSVCGKSGDAAVAAKSVATFQAKQAGAAGSSIASSILRATSATSANAGITAETTDTSSVDTGVDASSSTDVMTWLSENKSTVGVGLAILVGVIVLTKVL